MAVLITGGAGYIGSHTCAELLEAGREIIVADRPELAPAIDRVRAAVGKDVAFHPLEPLDRRGLQRIFEQRGIEAVIHFAGIRPVIEHQRAHLPIAETVILCEVMRQYGVRRLVFSSSSAVYGKPKRTPVAETAQPGAANRYGRTLLMIEDILRDLYEADRKWSIALLRNFNPAGAHPSGWIDGEAADAMRRDRRSERHGGAAVFASWKARIACGGEEADGPLPGGRTGGDGVDGEPAGGGFAAGGEDGAPPHLMPRLLRTAVGRQDMLPVFGGDYPTRDGTCVRDYVHVTDLAKGHVKALDKVMAESGIDVYNLGTGVGHSVLEVIAAFEKASGVAIPHRIVERRPGDAPVICADPSKARRELGWQAGLGLDRMCEDAWRWMRGRLDGPAPGIRARGAGGAAG